MNKKNTFLLLIILILSGIILTTYYLINTKSVVQEDTIRVNEKQILINNKVLTVEVVSNEADQNRGLSYRDGLEKNHGMLFDFSTQQNIIPGFWMKEMKFDLDIIWIKNKKIIAIDKNIPHPKTSTESLPSYFPPSAIDYVLEVESGWSEKNEIKIGDEILIRE